MPPLCACPWTDDKLLFTRFDPGEPGIGGIPPGFFGVGCSRSRREVLSFPDLGHPISYYRRTWLKTVVAQIRFNPILKIGQEAPAAFQDLVRGTFPKFLKEQS